MNNKYKIYLLAFVGFLVSTSQFMIAGVLDKIAVAFDVSIGDAGQLVTIFAVASGFGTPFFVMYLAKYTLRKQLLSVLVLFLISTILTPLSPDYTSLMIARAITGLATSTFIVSAYALASKLAPAGKQGSAIADVALGLSLALVVGIPFGRFISISFQWEAIFWIIAFLVFIGMLMVLWLIPNVKNSTPIPISEQISFLKTPNTLFPLLATLVVFTAYSMINTYITPILLAIENISEHQVGIVFFLIGIASLVGSKFGATLADKIGTRPILFATTIIVLFSLMAISFYSQSILMINIMLVLLTTSIWMFGPTQSYNLAKLAPHAVSIIIGLNSSFVQLGFAAGAGIGGLVIEKYTTSILGFIAAFIVIFAIGIIYIDKKSSSI